MSQEELPEPDRCRNLFCRGMFTNFRQPAGKRVTSDGSFWCGMTQTNYGPDSQLVGDTECRQTTRSCYK